MEPGSFTMFLWPSLQVCFRFYVQPFLVMSQFIALVLLHQNHQFISAPFLGDRSPVVTTARPKCCKLPRSQMWWPWRMPWRIPWAIPAARRQGNEGCWNSMFKYIYIYVCIYLYLYIYIITQYGNIYIYIYSMFIIMYARSIKRPFVHIGHVQGGAPQL